MNRLIVLFLFLFFSVSGFSQFDWIGTFDNNWNDIQNWAGNAVPTSNDNVLITSGSPNSPIIIDSVSCKNLTIPPGGNVTITTGVFEAFGSVDNQGSIVIGTGNFISNVSFDATFGGIDFNGDGELIIKHISVISFGNLDQANGTVNYHASGFSQSIEENQTFSNLKIDNSDGLQLVKSIVINNGLFLTNGLIYSDNVNTLTMGVLSFVNGVSDSSHVVGEMEKESNSLAPFTFPIGDNDNYMGLTITPVNSPSTYRAEFDQSSIHSSVVPGSTPVSGMDHISELYWWNLQGPNCDVGLNWNSNSLVDDHLNIVLAYYNVSSGQWEDAGSSLTSSNGGGFSSNADGRVSSTSGNLGIGNFTLGSMSIPPNNPFKINVPKTYVPDNNFENYLETHNASGGGVSVGDPNSMGDGTAGNDSVITSRISGANWLNLSAGVNIADITGIAGFTSLTQLNCNNNSLTVVDFSSNTSIQEIYCDNNQIDSINVNGFANLTTITFNGNPLKYLNCANTGLGFLDFTSMPPLETLIATNCTGLTNLNIPTANANLTDLQITGCSGLGYLGFNFNKLVSLDLTGCLNLQRLFCSNNLLTSLDISPCNNLTNLMCHQNNLTVIDLSNNPSLDTLDISNNQLSNTINLSANTMLKAVKISTNLLTNINLSANTALTSLDVSDNTLSFLDLRNGFNTNVPNFSTLNNPNLFCISVDDPVWSTANWTVKDAQTFFSTNCAGIPEAGFTSNQTEFCLGNSVIFTDTSTNSPTSWSWDFGDGINSSIQNPTHTYSVAGVYTVILTASNVNGSTTETGFITVYPNPVVSSITPTDISCNGISDGSIGLTVSGGTPNYSFSWSNGETSEDISSLPVGTYSVTITDDNLCSLDTSAIINEPLAITVNDVITHASCFGVCDGAINLTINGGSPGYLYSWFPGGETTQNLANLCAGIYSIEIIDDNGCIASNAYTVNEPAAVPVDAGTDQAVCEGNSVTLTGSGANSYSWDNGLGAGTSHVVSPFVTTTYIVTGDANSCINVDSVTVFVNSIPVVEAGLDSTICVGDSIVLSGQVTSGGAFPFNYVWNNGVTDGDPFAPQGTATYVLTVTDNLGCVGSDSVDVTVVALPNVYAGLDTTVCEGELATLFGSGANSYSWNNLITNGIPFLPAVGITKYIVTGTDGNSCINVDSVTVFVNSIPVVEAGLGHTICEGDSIVLSGLVTSGGTPIYNYVWDNGVTDGDPFAPQVTATYVLTVTDNFGCVGSDSVDITVVALPSVSAGSNFTVCPLEPIVLSGAGAANYTWNNNVIDGVQFSQGTGAVTYSVTGFANGCHATATIVVTELPELVVDYQITHAECDSANGSVVAVPLITGPSYTYSWSNGEVGNFAEDLTAGPLNIMISDGQCNYYDVILVGNANGGPTVNVNNVIGESCLGASDGEIELIISSSNSPYSVSWLCAGNDESITNLPAGLYQFTVTDQSNCITSDFVHVSAPDSLAISTVTIADPTCGLSDGSISLSVTGGSGTVTYTWSANASGQTGSSITGLAAGLYSVTISDLNSCDVTEYFQVNNASSLAIGLSSINVPSCGNTGGFNVFAQGGNSPYSYLWNNGDTTQNLIAVESGNYSLEVSDSLGCLAYFNQELLPTNQFNPSICMVTVDSISENNIIVWEKPITAGDISHFNIYRECCSSGLTNYLATVPYDSLSEYMDTTCLPQSTNWSYQLTVVDTCGNESFKSTLHRSIHVATFPEASNTVGLYWNQYIGFPYATHYIYRNHPSTGLELLDSVDYAVTSYVDANPVAPFNDLFYMIELIPPSLCTSTKAVDHNSSRSNRGGFNEVEEPDGVINQELGKVSVYPNPTNGELMLTINQISLPCKIEITDIRGRIIYTKKSYTKQLKINLSSYEKGMYILSVSNEQQKKEIKIIKN